MNYKLRVKPQQIIIVCKYTIVIGVVKCFALFFPHPLEALDYLGKGERNMFSSMN
jgi:hypothetical protein